MIHRALKKDTQDPVKKGLKNKVKLEWEIAQKGQLVRVLSCFSINSQSIIRQLNSISTSKLSMRTKVKRNCKTLLTVNKLRKTEFTEPV